MKKAKEISLERAKDLKSSISEFLMKKESIPSGMDDVRIQSAQKLKRKILSFFHASEDEWNDYHWQLSHRINSIETLKQLIPLSEEDEEGIQLVEQKYRWSISPYYLSLTSDQPLDPIRLQSIPIKEENVDFGERDPMDEKFTNPAGSITRRYPDRLIINVTNACAMYCRHCQRRRTIGTVDHATSVELILESVDYIRENSEIRDVLITGGDPLTLSDAKLETILKAIREIPHVEIIRIGTRTITTLPQRITPELTSMLTKYHPLYINTQFNHPLEVTTDSKAACERLVNAGIPVGNQAVLLNSINNDKYVMEKLNHLLLICRVKPYYIFHAKFVIGTTHFNTSIDDGLTIMEHLRGRTSGLAIPTYIINAPHGLGKTPIAPEYIIKKDKDFYKIRTWEGHEIEYPNHATKPLRKEKK